MIGREAERELVGDEHLRFEHEHRGQREHPLLAARQRPGALPAALTEAGEQLVGLLERGVDPVAAEPAPEPEREVLLDGQRGEDRPALGCVRDAGSGEGRRPACR